MCDRTLDFLQLIDRFTKPGDQANRKKLDNSKSKNPFQDSASDIAKGIHRTSSKLAKLTQLVKRQGLFDDPTEEINSFIFHIKQDLDELNSQCDIAQKYVDEKKRQMGSANQFASHNTKVVSQLKTELLHKTKDFKSVLEMRSSKMKDQNQRKVQLTGNGVLSPMKQLAATNQNHNENDGLHKRGSKTTNHSSSSLPTPYSMLESNGSGFAQDSPVQLQYQQQQLLLAPVATQQYYEAREQSVNEVEKTIHELGSLFKRLATMISEQQEMVERIDDDIENAVSDAEKGHSLLLKAYESVSSNRGLFMKLAAILALFILFFVLFIL